MITEHYLLQPVSSAAFSQSALPSHFQLLGTHWFNRPPQWNSLGLHVFPTEIDEQNVRLMLPHMSVVSSTHQTLLLIHEHLHVNEILTAGSRELISAVTAVICTITYPSHCNTLPIATLEIPGAASANLCKTRQYLILFSIQF